MKHTKGPWKINIDTGEYGVYHLYSPDIGGDEVFEREEIDEANARLIAAAPELLEALDILTDEVERHWPRNQRYPETSLGVAKRAIVKANGE